MADASQVLSVFLYITLIIIITIKILEQEPWQWSQTTTTSPLSLDGEHMDKGPRDLVCILSCKFVFCIVSLTVLFDNTQWLITVPKNASELFYVIPSPFFFMFIIIIKLCVWKRGQNYMYKDPWHQAHHQCYQGENEQGSRRICLSSSSINIFVFLSFLFCTNDFFQIDQHEGWWDKKGP
jgi:hypothetical protein